MPKSLKEKVVLVTGASTGIGRATALKFAEAGAYLALAARREEKLQEVARQIRGSGGKALVLVTDVGDSQQLEAMVQKTIAHYGRVDVLVNNAGIGLLGPLVETPAEKIRQLFEINFFACLQAIQSVHPQMRAQGGGQIINISSIVGLRAIPSVAAYCATKFALNAISDAVRIELKEDGIEVLSIYPGSTRSDFHKNQQVLGKAPKHPQWFVKSSEQVARAIVRASLTGKRDTIMTLSARLMGWVHHFSPHLLDQIIALGYRSYRRGVDAQRSE